MGIMGLSSGETRGWLPTCDCQGNDGSARSLVLDPFGGSGTTGVVAAIHGRDYMLFEANDKYVEMARTRIREEAAQPLMRFVYVPSLGWRITDRRTTPYERPRGVRK